MKWAVKTRYLGYDNKWHQHTTKWHDNSSEAWEEKDRWEKTINCYESQSSLIHK